MHQGLILLVPPMIVSVIHQFFVGGWIFADQHHPRGLSVQPLEHPELGVSINLGIDDLWTKSSSSAKTFKNKLVLGTMEFVCLGQN